MHKSDRIEAGCTVEDEPYKLLERDAEKSISAGPLRSPSGQLPFSTSLKAPVPLTHDAVTVPVMFGVRTSVDDSAHTTVPVPVLQERFDMQAMKAAPPLRGEALRIRILTPRVHLQNTALRQPSNQSPSA